MIYIAIFVAMVLIGWLAFSNIPSAPTAKRPRPGDPGKANRERE